MEKLTLTRKEAAELLGLSTATVTQWVLEGRLKAYRVSDRPKSPYLFTREDCQAALLAVEVEPIKLKEKERKAESEVEFTRRQKEVNKKLRQMLNMPEKE
ncbi:helix-turn-helix domain-containing protein [Salmonella enterica subsp. enterica]|uniref:excisionase family DNA-binding protein n=1 Tax=Salmonella enterica TaxID=28901 RepID=UPI0012C74DBE|nr:helix-turn-helix domain-containing protein [Salmonella enterica]EBG6922880.1 helix-turn-helix domain-containing protein [Salmonella enterica subsp. enterica]EBW9496450.1 excisionase [Salmonella enterica subsp. enterica serovar Brandenburg]EBY2674819.1 helix-turn-helix domain-containing protein [Salmonella enterica subsp. enterica serovar Schwarzengrund]ECB7382886.1 helix-turn-helix domain-containing protein [Salmonella enterica subsp. enterica serovar Brandenburg]ECN6005669.1 helix-turn-hel